MELTNQIAMSDTPALVAEWRALTKRLRDVEFERCRFACKVRRRCANDIHFKEWCVVNLQLDDAEAAEMVTLAIAGHVFGDAVELRTRRLSESVIHSLSEMAASAQEKIMRLAQKENLTVLTLLHRSLREVAVKVEYSPSQDVRRLAAYLAKNADKLPESIREIVARYVKISDAAAVRSLSSTAQ